MQKTLENTLLFSFPHQTLPRKCWCWTLILLDTECTAQPSLSASERTFVAQCPLSAIPLPSSPGPRKLLPGLLLCTLMDFFFFNLCILITRPPFQKAGCFEIMKSFHRSCCFLFLWIPLLTESYRFPEGNCLDFFIASICSHQSHWQTFCLFFRDTKTKPNAIRQRSAHMLNHEQGLGSLVK